MPSEFPAFSWETLLLVTDRRRVGEPVEALADILIDLFGYPREDDRQRRQMICALLEENKEQILIDGPGSEAYVKEQM